MCHMDDSAKGRYNTTLGRYLLFSLRLELNRVIVGGKGLYEEFLTHMVDRIN